MKHLIGALVASTIVVLGPTAGPALACRPVAGVYPTPCAAYFPPTPPAHWLKHHGPRGHFHTIGWR